MLFIREGAALLSLIKWNYDAKLIKQQLLDVFWWYFITVSAGWNCTFLVIFELPISTPNIWNIFVSSPLHLVWYSSLKNMVHTSLTNLDLVGLSTMHYCVKFSKIGYRVPTLNTMVIFANWSRWRLYIYLKCFGNCVVVYTTH